LQLQSSSTGVSIEEVADQRDHFIEFVLESKMAGVDEMKLNLGKVALVVVTILRNDDGNIASVNGNYSPLDAVPLLSTASANCLRKNSDRMLFYERRWVVLAR
jgi:hypothetical protein